MSGADLVPPQLREGGRVCWSSCEDLSPELRERVGRLRHALETGTGHLEALRALVHRQARVEGQLGHPSIQEVGL